MENMFRAKKIKYSSPVFSKYRRPSWFFLREMEKLNQRKGKNNNEHFPIEDHFKH